MLAACALSVWVGCVGAATPVGAGDAATAQDGAPDASVDVAPDARDAAAEAATDAPVDVSPGTCATMPVAEVASRASVRFRFAATTGWVATQGRYCLPMKIDRVGGGDLLLGFGAGCLCECPAPPPPSVVAVRALDGSAELRWDGRALATCTSAVDCATRGWPGVGVQYETRAAAQPVAAGQYHAVFAVYDEAPTYCFGDGGVRTCSPPPGPPMLGGFGSGNVLCNGARRVEVTFELPASGEVVVDVP